MTPRLAAPGKRNLLLIRHGRSSIRPEARSIDSAGVARWRSAVDQGAIRLEVRPPVPVAEQVRHADHIVASDLPRASASARLLAPERNIELSPLLRETALEVPALGNLSLPPLAWEVAIHASWLVRLALGRREPASELQRAAACAKWLDALSRDGEMVVAVTHGVFRRVLRTELKAIGWTDRTTWRTHRHWSVWHLQHVAR